jgi:hypothetical protein
VYIPNILSALNLYCIQVFHVASVSCSKGTFRESEGHGPGAGRRGAASQRPADGAHDTSKVLRTGRARPHPGSRIPLAWREEGSSEGVAGTVRVHMRGATWWTGVGYACMAGRLGQQHARDVQSRSSAPAVWALVIPINFSQLRCVTLILSAFVTV